MIRRRLSLSLLFLLIALPVVAQSLTFPIPIHGSFQCQSYVDDATPVTPGVTCHLPASTNPLSAQGHWAPANSQTCEQIISPGLCADFTTGYTGLVRADMGHTHAECFRPPIYGAVSAPFTLQCQAVLFHLDGEITDATNVNGTINFGALQGIRLFGDPNGIVTFPFTLTVNPQTWAAGRPHGWVANETALKVRLSNGEVTGASLVIPYYAAFDLSAPEAPVDCDGCGPLLRARTDPFGGVPGDQWGANTMETVDVLPILAPISARWCSGSMKGYAYGIQATGVSFENDPYGLARADLNLHMGIEGQSITPGCFDPAELGPGIHRIAEIWRGTSHAGSTNTAPNESVATLLVFDVTIDPNAPPPTQPMPVNCVQSAWVTTSTDVTYSNWVVVGDHEERTVTTIAHQTRTILTQPAHGGTPCGPSMQDVTTVTTESRFPPPPPSSLSGCQAVVSNPTTTAAINTLIAGLPGGGLVCVPTGTYVLDVTQAPIRLGSHITLLLWPGAILQAAPNALEEFSVVTIHGTDDSRIMGQGEIRGDRLNHLGTTGEWGHGVVLEGSSNTVIDGITIDEHWGDGIYVTDDGNPSHPTTFLSIHHVLLRHNRRNNLSAINWDGGQISGSTFREAGGTAPGAGMDFEPNFSTQVVSGLIVTGNWFYANQGAGFETIATNGPVKSSIVTSNISASNGGAGFLFQGALTWTAANNYAAGNGQ